MTKTDIVELFEYNQWAKTRLMTSLEAMKHEDIGKDLHSSHGGILGTLLHMVNAESVWTSRLRGEEPRPINSEEVKNLGDLKTKWDELDKKLSVLISDYSDGDLLSEFEYQDSKGKKYLQPRIWAFNQLFNHFTYHRGQVVAMQRQLGYKPANTDLIGFYREKRI
jgi:uncharacterized damage-inducible protein DinB